MTTIRAPKGGALGANGEWYEGGKFIATTDHPKGQKQRKSSKIRKVEIEPYVYEVAPDGYKSIYQKISAFLILKPTLNIDHKVLNFYYGDDEKGKEEIISLVTYFQMGLRWFTKNEQGHLIVK